MHTTLLLCLGALVLSLSPLSLAQGPCTWTPLGSGVGGLNYPFVSATGTFDDGSGSALYVGGRFASAGGTPANYIAKWDGAVWAPLGSGLSGTCGLAGCKTNVRTFADFDDGSGMALYVGGSFTLAGGMPAINIARWDGSTWTSVGGGISGVGSYSPSGGVSSLAVFDDGTGPALYAGGVFSSAGGGPAQGTARWNGSSWSPLGSGLVSAPGLIPASVNSLVVYNDGTGPALYGGGLFFVYGALPSVPDHYVARWDGNTWTALAGLDSVVRSLSVYDDGSGPALYAAGHFTTAGGVPANQIAKWDGSTWAPLATGPFLPVFGPFMLAMEVFDDGTGPALFVGGGNTAWSASSPYTFSSLARWDGSNWTPFVGLNSIVTSLLVFDDAQAGPALYVAGIISTAGGVSANGIARWSCGSNISVSFTQPGGSGTPVFLSNTNLTPGNDYYNIFSLDLCPGGPGTGLYGGLCVTSPANFQFVLDQLYAPLGTSPIHFTAPSSYMTAGPFALPPLTVEAITFDFTGGVLGPISQVATITVQ